MVKFVATVTALALLAGLEPSPRSTKGSAPGTASPPPPAKPQQPPTPPPLPPPPPPPPPMPGAMDCWKDFLVAIQTCQHEFEGTDRIQVALRRTALNGAGTALNSCLNIIPPDFPPTETPEAPIGSPPLSCLQQLFVDIRECRTKFSPGVVSQQSDPDRDTMKNAFDQCLGGAMSKNGWCNGRKPNNPAQQVQINLLKGPRLTDDREGVTVIVAHTAGAPINISWMAAVFDRQNRLVSRLLLGTTVGVPGVPTAMTLPLTERVPDGADVVVLGEPEGDGDPFAGVGG